MSNLTKRILVAAVGIPIVVYLCFSKPISLLGLVLILAMLAVHEFYSLAKIKGFVPQVTVGMISTGLILLSFARYRLHLPQGSAELLALACIVTVIATFTSELFKGYPNPFVQISMTIAGALYVGIGLGAFYGIHEYFFVNAALTHSVADPNALATEAGFFIITLLSSIWIGDTAAFMFGRKFGKHKLYERVSPGKTWEGAIPGFVFANITWFTARAFIPSLQGLSISTTLAMGCISGIFATVGDLAESLLKRDAGVKDSSSLIPGHGGVLDRLDSILFVSPLVYLYLSLFGL